MYKLKDEDGEYILGKFYEEVLSAVGKKEETPRIDKILKRRIVMVLVKWDGYNNSHNSWIPERDAKK